MNNPPFDLVDHAIHKKRIKEGHKPHTPNCLYNVKTKNKKKTPRR